MPEQSRQNRCHARRQPRFSFTSSLAALHRKKDLRANNSTGEMAARDTFIAGILARYCDINTARPRSVAVSPATAAAVSAGVRIRLELSFTF